MQNNHQNTKKCHVYTFKPSKVSHTVPAISRRLLPDPGVGYLAPMPRDPRALAQGPEEVRKERGVARLLEEERRDHDFRQGPARAASREKKNNKQRRNLGNDRTNAISEPAAFGLGLHESPARVFRAGKSAGASERLGERVALPGCDRCAHPAGRRAAAVPSTARASSGDASARELATSTRRHVRMSAWLARAFLAVLDVC